jgi:non-ribosomal peptide synthetase component E (peptide arylation enzyme)
MSKDPGVDTPRFLQILLRDLILPVYLRPTRATILDVVPLTRAGKVDCQHLKMEVPQGKIIEVVQPASSFEEHITLVVQAY